MDKRAEDIGILLKSRLCQLETGNCKMHNRGYCNCNLCLVDGLLSLLSKKDEKIEELEKESERKEGIFMRVVNQKSANDLLLSNADDRIKSLEEGLVEIAKGRGRYDLDNHQHAINTIEDMKAIANKLLEKKGVGHGSSSQKS